jgi:hypothetical protein
VQEIILEHREIDVIESPVRAGQEYYIVLLHDYIHLVPVIEERVDRLILKTIFPSRKYDKIYREAKNEKKSRF